MTTQKDLHVKVMLLLKDSNTGEVLVGPFSEDFTITPKQTDPMTETEIMFLCEKVFCYDQIKELEANPLYREKISGRPWITESRILNIA